MNNKEELVNNIKQWIKIDNEIKQLQKEVNSRKKIKKDLNINLIELMKHNDIDTVETKDGSSIIYTTKTVKKPITKKLLSNILAKYYNGDANKAEHLNNFILENRETTVRETIERK
jgi:hypothetical protein